MARCWVCEVVFAVCFWVGCIGFVDRHSCIWINLFHIPYPPCCRRMLSPSDELDKPPSSYKDHSLSVSQPPEFFPKRSNPLIVSQRSAGSTSQDTRTDHFEPPRCPPTNLGFDGKQLHIGAGQSAYPRYRTFSEPWDGPGIIHEAREFATNQPSTKLKNRLDHPAKTSSLRWPVVKAVVTEDHN